MDVASAARRHAQQESGIQRDAGVTTECVAALRPDVLRPGDRLAVAACLEEIAHDGGVLGVALGQAERVLGAVDADPERDDTEVIGEVHTVDQ